MEITNKSVPDQEQLLIQAQKVVNSVGIPSQPKIVLDIFDLIDRPDTNFRDISALISKDVSLSAKIIKVANSPFFAPASSIESINQALSFLGLENFYQLILSSALEKAMSDHSPEFSDIHIFWNHSMNVAGISKMLVEKFQLGIGDALTEQHAYMAGLFHDCAIPLLMKKYENYSKDIGLPIQNNPLITNDEIIYFYTNHSLAGYLVAKSWKLPKNVCSAIRYHHDERLIDRDDWVSRRLVSILFLAEHLWQDTKMSELPAGGMELDKTVLDDLLYEKILESVLDELSIKPQELDDIKAEIFEQM